MDLLNIKTLSPETSTQVISRPKTDKLNTSQNDLGEAAPIAAPKHKVEFLPWTAPVILTAGVALLLVVYLGQFASLIRTQYKVVALKDKHRQLERERIDLQLQIQKLTSLERIEAVAFKNLKMTTPNQRLVLQMNSDGRPSKVRPKTQKTTSQSGTAVKD
jgi:cell division protein FtsL